MKKLILIAISLCYMNAYAQRDLSIGSTQQLFIYKKFADKKISIKDTMQVDSLYRSVQSSWERYVKDSLASSIIPVSTLNNIDAYAQFMTLIWATGKTHVNDELDFHVFKNYTLPSLKKTYEIIKAKPTADNFKLIGIPAFGNAISIGAKYTTDIKTFNSLYTLCYIDFRSMFQKYGASDTLIAKSVGSLLNNLRYNEHDMKSKYYLLNGQPDLSLLTFITGLSINNYYLPSAVRFGSDLVRYFYVNNEKDKALTILNTLMFYTSADDLSRDSLLHWYIQTDPARGEKLYQLTKQKISGSPYKASDVVKFKSPAKWNLLGDPAFASKIAGAKYFIVDFWFTHCGPCIGEIPKLNELANNLRNRQDIVFLSINTDYSNGGYNEDYVRKFMKEHKISFPVVYDTKATAFNEQLKVNGYPTKFILDNKGHVISKIDDSQTTLETVNEFLKIGGLR